MDPKLALQQGGPMTVPNWQHHSSKAQKRKLKPQKLRQAKKRRAMLLTALAQKSPGQNRGIASGVMACVKLD